MKPYNPMLLILVLLFVNNSLFQLSFSTIEHINTLMNFFTRWLVLGLIIAFGTNSNAQNCPQLSLQLPDSVCLNQPIRYPALPASYTYSWDMCSKDMETVPQISFHSAPNGNYTGTSIVEDSNQYFIFFANFSNSSLSRASYGSNLAATPSIVSLGNFGGLLSSPGGIQIVKEGGQWFGFVANLNGNRVVRLAFGSSLRNSNPIATTLPMPTGLTLTGCSSIKIRKSGGNYVAFILGGASNRLFVLDLGTNLAGNPVSGYSVVVTGANNTYDLDVEENCGNWFGLITDFAGSRVFKVDFGQNLNNPNPNISNVTQSIAPIANPQGITIVRNNGQYYGVTSFSNSQAKLIRLNSGLTNAPIFATPITGALAGSLAIGPSSLTLSDGKILIVSMIGNRITQFQFAASCGAVVPGSSSANPTIQYSQPGKYYVSLIAKDSSSNRSTNLLDSIVVKSTSSTLPTPILDIIADDACQGSTTRLTALVNGSPGVAFNWAFHDNTAASGASVTKTYPGPGFYNVRLRVRTQDGCGTFELNRQVKIFPTPGSRPVSDFTFPSQICALDSVQFSDASSWAQGTIVRWRWTIQGVPGTIYERNPKIWFPTTGNVQVTLIASDSSGCGVPVTKTVVIRPSSVVSFSSTTACEGSLVNFTDLTTFQGGTTFSSRQWNFGVQNATSTLANPTFIYPDFGLFNVRLSVTNSAGCVSSITQPIRIFAKPILRIEVPTLPFANQALVFNNQSLVPLQTIDSIRWEFPFVQGQNQISFLSNPSYTFPNPGLYPIKLRIKTNRGCISDSTFQVGIIGPCPTVSASSPAEISTGELATFTPTSVGASAIEWDFCPGDLFGVPVSQNINLGSATGFVQPVFDGENWFGFVPADQTTNGGNSLFRLNFGNNLNNDPGISPLGNPQNAFNRPTQMRMIRENGIWYGLGISSLTNTISRLRFGSSLDSVPTAQTISLPQGVLSTPSAIRLYRDRDTTIVFIVNNNNAITNNIIRLIFRNSILDTPQVAVFSNPPVIQNSTGFLSIDFQRECNEWYGLLVGASQVYKMRFGISLARTPQFTNITDQIVNLLPSSVSLSNLRGVNIVSDLGQTLAFLNNNTGNFYRVTFLNGMMGNPTSASFMGSLGLINNLTLPTFINQQSEHFAFSMDATARTLNRIKFPNQCGSTPEFVLTSIVNQAQTVKFDRSGNQKISYKAVNNFGWNSTSVSSIQVADLPDTHAPLCLTPAIQTPNEACVNQQFLAKPVTSGLKNLQWDFCEGDLLNPPIANPLFPNPTNAFASANGYEVIEYQGNYYGFLVHSGTTMVRVDYGNNLLNNPILSNFSGAPAGFFTGATEIKIRFHEGKWIGLLLNGSNDNLGRINFGTDLLNLTPAYSVISLGSQLDNPRGMEVIYNGANFYALIVNRNTRALLVLDFGKSLLNTPVIYSYNIPVFTGATKIAAIQHCNVWYALVTDITNNAVYRLEFRNGLYKAPELTGTFSINTPMSVNLVCDMNRFIAFVGNDATGNTGAMFRLNFGASMASNNVAISNLGNFSGLLTSSSIMASSLFKASTSEYQLHMIGANNRNLIRFQFANRCAVTPGTSTTDSVQVSYATPGTYFVSLSGFDSLGRQVKTLDSIQVRNPVEARFGFDGNRCRNLPITFLDSTLINSPNPPSYSWNFGDPESGNQNTSNLRFPVHNFRNPGTYVVTLSVAEASGCTSQVSRTVQILNKPSPAFSFNIGSGCSNDSIQFNDLTQPGLDQIVGWEWDFGGFGTSTLQNPRFSFPSAGTFAVRLKVIGASGCDSSISRQLTINRQGPSVQIGLISGSFCLGDTLQYQSNIVNPGGTSLDSLVWNLGNGVISRQQNPLMFYPATGTYRVMLTAYNNQGCTTRVERNVRVYAKPRASIRVNQSLICMRSPLLFSSENLVSEGVVVSQRWNFGDGTSDTSFIATKSYLEDGRYQVQLLLTSQYGCTGLDTTTIDVKRGPIANFDFSTACLSRPVNFINRSSANGIPGGIISHSWNFGNGLTFNGMEPPPVVYNSSGDYTVSLTVTTTAECPATTTKVVSIGNLLSANFTFEQGCLGTPYLFRDISVPAGSRDSVVSWDWTIGGQRFNIKNPRVLFDFTGEYSVNLTVATGNGCQSSITATNVVQVGSPAVAEFEILNTTFAAPPFVVGIRNNSSNAIEYKWDFGDSTTSTASNPPSHVYRREGVYTITLTAFKNKLCSTMISKVVNVILNPVRGVRVRTVSAAERAGVLTFGAEVENESNVELRALDFRAELNDQTVLNESWTGSLLPGALLTYTFKSQIALNRPGSIDFVCISASLPDTATDISPDNNRGCFALGSAFRLFNVYPNPTKNELNASYVLDKEGKLSIEIVDALGRGVWLLEDVVKQAGVYQPKYSFTLKPGFYTLRASFEGTKVVKRLVVEP